MSESRQVLADPGVAMPEEPSRGGDFGALYRATVAPLRRYLGRLLGNSAEAQEVAHDAYLRIFPAEQKAPADRPEALLYVTARRLAINRLKRRSVSPFVREAVNLEAAASGGPGVVQQVMAHQELQLLERAIRELPAGCRSVLLLRRIEELSHREIAARLGIAVSTVEKQHARALRLLREAMNRPTPGGAAAPGLDPGQEAQS